MATNHTAAMVSCSLLQLEQGLQRHALRVGFLTCVLFAQGPAGSNDANLIQRLEDELLLHTAALGGAGGSDLQLYSVESDMRFHPEISRRAHQRAPRSLEELSEGDRLRRHCYLVGCWASGLLS